jgi:uncharacterized membrane protein (UPF0127 family)
MLLGLLASCNRTEEAKSLSDSGAFAATGEVREAPPAPAASAPRPTERDRNEAATRDPGGTRSVSDACIVPLPEVPPPKAPRANSCPKSEGAVPTLARTSLSFPDAPGAPTLSVEIAQSDSEHARGLMYRTHLPENDGMIFAWPTEQRRAFWMRNTCLPLDMLFITRHKIIAGILEQVPVLNEEPRTVPCPAAYVLEVNAGWTRRHGIKPGTRIALHN